MPGMLVNEPAISLELDVVLKLITAQGQVSRRFAGPLGGLHGLGISDLAILFNLVGAPGGRLRRTDLAERLAMTPSGVTRALLPLERIGLVRREAEPRDARVAYASLTPVGRSRLHEARETALAICTAMFGEGWLPGEVEVLAGFLDRLGGVGLPRDPERAASAG